MTRSELIQAMTRSQDKFESPDVDSVVEVILDQMVESLSQGQRVEVRGFGSFALRYREARKGRNPKTGESVELNSKYVPHFKPGKGLKERVDIK